MNRRSARRAAAAIALAALAAVAVRGRHHDSATGAGAQPAGVGTVARVVDGDTIIVRLGTRGERVRLIGINTPESVDPRKPVECFGKEASHHTAALLPPGTPVRLVGDAEARDKYRRLLAYVYRSRDGLFVNLELARDGWAEVLTFPPNVAHTTEFVAAVADARAAGRGLWSACPGAR